MNGVHRIRMLISDVDGTLLNPKGELSKENLAAIVRCRQDGLRFSLSSARPPFGMHWLIRKLRIQTVCSGLNGAVLFHPERGLLEECALDHRTIGAVAALMQEFGLDVWLYTREQWFVPRIDGPRVRHNTDSLQTEPRLYAGLLDITAPILKIVGTADDLRRLTACGLELVRTLEGRVSITRSQPHYIDVTHPSADKGTAAIVIATAEGMEMEEVAVVGDSPADVAMFRIAGLSVAMGQASEEVRRTAAEVTGTNRENGVALLIDRLLDSKSLAPISH
jgi:hypothetical protein